MTTKSDRRTAVAIIGGGASGTILAAQLAKRGIKALIAEGSGRAGRGVAYSTPEDVHLLNVRAEGMSAWAHQPDHFARHFAAQGGEPSDFAQRQVFGGYLGKILEEAQQSGNIAVIHTWAVRASRSRGAWRVSFADGSVLEADALVLATGNQEPEAVAAFVNAGHRFIGNPWGGEARAAIAEIAATGGAALLLGTGLTMVDLVLSLEAAGHQGNVVALSRRGLAPRAHAKFAKAGVTRSELPAGLRPLLRWLRRRSADVGWRAAIDSLRPHSHSIWQSFTPNEQRQFLRHARPWWDVHRHRIAPEVAASLANIIAEGRLEIIAGEIVGVSETASAITISYRLRGTNNVQSRSFAFVFNCTGPLPLVERSKDPLLRNLLDAQEVRPDHLGIGLDVDPSCRAGNHLWAMGGLTKGRFWEITAVPDIREQAAAIAADIERELSA